MAAWVRLRRSRRQAGPEGRCGLERSLTQHVPSHDGLVSRVGWSSPNRFLCAWGGSERMPHNGAKRPGSRGPNRGGETASEPATWAQMSASNTRHLSAYTDNAWSEGV